MIKHFFSKQFLKFLFVGGSAAILNWISRIILNLWTTFPIAVALAYLFGMSFAFVTNKIFVFPQSNRSTKKQIRDFTVINLVNFPILWILSIIFKLFIENILGITLYSAEIAHFIALSIPMFINFLIYKFIAFGNIK